MASHGPNALRTRLGTVRGLGSAKQGAAVWWAQRLTALALVPLTIWFVVSLVALAGAPYAAFIAWIQGPVTAVLLVVFLAVGFHHMQLGLREVIEDYVHTEWRKIALIVFVKFASALAALAGIFAVLQIAFRA